MSNFIILVLLLNYLNCFLEMAIILLAHKAVEI